MRYPLFRLITLCLCLFASNAFAVNGLIAIKSAHSVAATADKLEIILADKGMTVFARIDHAKGAEGAGLELRPTQLLIFGNPKVGTPLMQCAQSVGIDLPQKALIWEDADGQVWIGYNDPQYLKKRHAIEGCDGVIKKVEGALSTFVGKAAE